LSASILFWGMIRVFDVVAVTTLFVGRTALMVAFLVVDAIGIIIGKYYKTRWRLEHFN
jgi:hypothetical protein